MRIIIAVISVFFLSIVLNAQQIKIPNRAANSVDYCDLEINEEFIRLNPQLKETIKKSENQLEQEYQKAIKNVGTRSAANDPKYVISVVFHILHANGTENISDKQVRDCIRVLNEDFMKQNSDTIDVFPEFKNEIGFTNIEFRLALKDPAGNPTNGINRYFEPSLTVNADENSKINQWDRSKYLNVWVVQNIGSGAAGYTFFPSTLNSYKSGDGIILLSTYVGSIGTSSRQRSRTLTHEIGHWLNLPHTWGFSNTPNASGNCNEDDNVYDTPNTLGNGSCNQGRNSCPNIDPHYGIDQIDNLQNYMDYAYCYMMFTNGQSTRMRTALESNIAERRNLWQPNTLTETGVNELLTVNIDIENPFICFGEKAQFKDGSYFTQDSWLWNFSGANLDSSIIQNPEILYTQPGIYDVGLKVSNSIKKLAVTKEKFIWALPEVGSQIPYKNSFENPNNFFEDVYINNIDEDFIKFDKTNAVSFDGNESMVLINVLNSPNSKDEFITGPVDVSALSQIEISWNYSFAQRVDTNKDVLRVLVSSDCGNTWREKYKKSGKSLATSSATSNSFAPKSFAEWRFDGTSPFSSAGPNNETLLIKFEFENGGGNNFYIDNIQVNGTYSPVVKLEYPRNGSVNVSSNPTIDWKATNGILEYEYQVDTNQFFDSLTLISGKKPFISSNPKNPDTEENLSNLMVNETYYWRVRAIAQDTIYNWSDTWSFKVSPNGVGVSEINNLKDDVLVFPNPTNGNFTLAFGDESFKTIEVYSALGKVISRQSTSKKTIALNLNNHPKGIYFIRVSQNTNSIVKRVILN